MTLYSIYTIRCDGYVIHDGDRMTAEEAEEYHRNQVKVLADGGVDYVMFACTVFPKLVYQEAQ